MQEIYPTFNIKFIYKLYAMHSGATRGRQMGNCPFHLEICPLKVLLVNFCPLKLCFFRIVFFIFELDSQCIIFRLNHKQGHLKLMNCWVDFFDSDSDCDSEKLWFFFVLTYGHINNSCSILKIVLKTLMYRKFLLNN